MDKEHEFEEQNILQEFLFYLHSPGIAECGDAERQSWDNMMLGAYSETSLAGVAAVNQIQFVYEQFLLALGDGLVIFCSQYWGKRQTAPMKKIAATAMHADF